MYYQANLIYADLYKYILSLNYIILEILKIYIENYLKSKLI